MKIYSYKTLLRLLTIGCLILIVPSCGCNNPNDKRGKIQGSDKVDVKNAGVSVSEAAGFSFTAQRSVTTAQAEIVKAKVHAKEIAFLVEKMREKKSQFAEAIENLRKIYVQHITVIGRELTITNLALKNQSLALSKADKEIEKANQQSIASENEKIALRDSNRILAADLEKYQAYKDKYHALTKYKWIVWGLGGWILVKFLGGLGMWSPQGRIAKALIG